MKTNTILFFLITIVIYSCTSGFERVVDLEEQQQDPTVYVTARYELGNGRIYISAVPTIGINEDFFETVERWYYDYDSEGNITDSMSYPSQELKGGNSFTARIFDDIGEKVYEVSCDSCYANLFRIDSTLIEANRLYTLEVDVRGFPTVKSSAKITSSPTMELVRVVENNLDGGYRLTFEVQDDPTQENAYAINGNLFDTSGMYFGEVYLDPDVQEFSDILYGYAHWYLTDEAFVDNKRKISLNNYESRFRDDSYVYRFNLLNYSDDYKDYDIRLNAIWEAESNPFLEPASSITNMENGLGFFTIVDRYSFYITPQEIEDNYLNQ